MFVRIRPNLGGFASEASAGIKAALTQTEAEVNAAARSNVSATAGQVDANRALAASYQRIAAEAVAGSAEQRTATKMAADAAAAASAGMAADAREVVAAQARQIEENRLLAISYQEIGAAAVRGSDEARAAALLAARATAAANEGVVASAGAASLATGRVRGHILNMGSALGIGFGAAIGVKLIKDVTSAAASVQKSGEVIRNAFGPAARRVFVGFGDTVAAKLGVSAALADATSARFGILFKNLGIGQNVAAGMTVGFEKLAGTISTIKGVDPTQVMQNIVLAAAGNTRGLKQLGIVVDTTSEKIAAFKLGLISSLKDALTPTVKTEAIYALATAHLGEFQREAAKHARDYANVQRRLSAELSNAKDIIGTALLPMFVHYTAGLADWLGRMNESGKLQRDFNEAARVTKEVVTDVANAVSTGWKIFQTAAGWVGGTKNAVELLLAALAVSKFAGVGRGVQGLVGTIGGIGRAARAASIAFGISSATIETESAATSAAVAGDAAATTAAVDTAAAASAAAIDAALISTGIGALVVAVGIAAVEIIQHWNTVKRWLADFGDWTKSHAYLLLALPIIGTIAFMAVEVIKHWNEIRAVAEDVANFVSIVFAHPVRTIEDTWRSLRREVDAVWKGLEIDAVRAALRIVEPFSHIPTSVFGVGFANPAQRAKAALQKDLADLQRTGVAQAGRTAAAITAAFAQTTRRSPLAGTERLAAAQVAIGGFTDLGKGLADGARNAVAQARRASAALTTAFGDAARSPSAATAAAAGRASVAVRAGFENIGRGLSAGARDAVAQAQRASFAAAAAVAEAIRHPSFAAAVAAEKTQAQARSAFASMGRALAYGAQNAVGDARNASAAVALAFVQAARHPTVATVAAARTASAAIKNGVVSLGSGFAVGGRQAVTDSQEAARSVSTAFVAAIRDPSLKAITVAARMAALLKTGFAGDVQVIQLAAAQLVEQARLAAVQASEAIANAIRNPSIEALLAAKRAETVARQIAQSAQNLTAAARRAAQGSAAALAGASRQATTAAQQAIIDSAKNARQSTDVFRDTGKAAAVGAGAQLGRVRDAARNVHDIVRSLPNIIPIRVQLELAQARTPAAQKRALFDELDALNKELQGHLTAQDRVAIEQEKTNVLAQLAYLRNTVTQATASAASRTAVDATAKLRDALRSIAETERQAIATARQRFQDAIVSAKRNLDEIGAKLAESVGKILDKLGAVGSTLAGSPQAAAFKKLRDLIMGGAPEFEIRRAAIEATSALQGAAKSTVSPTDLAKRQITALTAEFNKGHISLKTFNRRLAEDLKRDHVSYREAGKLLGTAFAEGYRAQLKAIHEQAAALGEIPRRERLAGGAGFAIRIIRPLETLHTAIAKAEASAHRQRERAMTEFRNESERIAHAAARQRERQIKAQERTAKASEKSAATLAQIRATKTAPLPGTASKNAKSATKAGVAP